MSLLERNFKFGMDSYFHREKAEKLEKLSSLSEFLQDIQVYNTRAKMVNLKYDVNRIEKEKENLLVVYQLEKLQQKLVSIQK